MIKSQKTSVLSKKIELLLYIINNLLRMESQENPIPERTDRVERVFRKKTSNHEVKVINRSLEK